MQTVDLLAPFGGAAPTIPAGQCLPGPTGQQQQGDVTIRATDWAAMDNVIWGVALIVAIIAVVLIYRSQLMGNAFARRWWTSWGVTAAVMIFMGLAIAALWPANTFGCQYGDVTTRAPFLSALGRGLLAGLWSLAWVLFLSVLLTRIARRTDWEPFARNSRTPF